MIKYKAFTACLYGVAAHKTGSCHCDNLPFTRHERPTVSCSFKCTCLSDDVQQSPSWDATSFSASEGISRILRKTGSLPYSQQPSTFPLLGQMNPIYIDTITIFNANFRIFVCFSRGSYSWIFPFRLPLQGPVCAHHVPQVPPISSLIWNVFLIN
jgi:hypothetical protein